MGATSSARLRPTCAQAYPSKPSGPASTPQSWSPASCPIVGEVLWVDRYGNCQLNIDPDQISSWGDRVQLRWTRPTEGTRTALRVRAFDELGSGQVGLVVDSYGLLAVALSRASAADALQIAAGDELALVPLGDAGEQEGDASAGNGARAGNSSPVSLNPRRPAGS
jgi:S-adenosyl-l-methionine hydroxide adenosyltransferase